MKKQVSMIMAGVLAASVLTAIPAAAEEKVSITIFNSKNELQETAP